ncbi:MAG: PBP1A family penicillin-binding protein [Desulfobacterales bacterium]|nr:PBP1A family penicillin-binding protein [Desulfobacterales bacterium]
MVIGGIFSIIFGAISAFCIYYYYARNLPEIATLRDYRPQTITTVYSDDGRKVGEFYKQRRIVIPIYKMPPLLVKAFIATEDSRFYEHKGIDFFGIIRAFYKNLRAGAIVQGGSTFTQQVIKNFLLTPEKKYDRKIKEAILAYRLEKKFTKEDILYMYLNDIYLGHGAYGVEAASENYFGKSVSELNLAECAMLAGLPQAPSRYSPFRHPERAKQRQILVLNRMVAEEYITNIQATEAINTVLDIKPRKNWFIEKVPFYTEFVRKYISEKYGDKALYEQGLKIYTSVNIEMQKAARSSLTKGLTELDKRQGYRGPFKTLELDKIEPFCQDYNLKLLKNPIEVEHVLKGVVIHVQDDGEPENRYVTVRMGNHRGVIKLTDMTWARIPDVDVKYFEGKITHPGEALAVGDMIHVKVKGILEDAKFMNPDDDEGKKKEKKKPSIAEDTLPEADDELPGADDDEYFDESEVLWALDLEQTPVVQGAILTMEASTGKIKVMIGGRDYRDNQFNRAIQSKRQPGSSFKPIIYAAALDKGYTPASMIVDSPVVVKSSESDFTWKPRNYGKKFYGPTLLRRALAKSYNVVTVKILRSIGIDYVIDYSKKLGITSHLRREGGLALGSSGVSLLEMVRSYSVFANLGYLVDPVFITKIEDRDGNIIEESSLAKKQVIDMSTSYIMTNLLESVVKTGTGKKIRVLKRPVAGKTGTTNKQNDAWFVGYTPEYVTGTWVGHDVESFLGWGETGAGAAIPIWLNFMQDILKNKPVKGFQVPEGVVFAKIDAETGLLPIPESKKTIFECFKEGTIPKEYSPKPDAIDENEEIWKFGAD